MKLYKVTVTHTTVLMANSIDEAERDAKSHAIDIIREEEPGWHVTGEVVSMNDLPPRWGPGCVPWNTETFDPVEEVIRVLDGSSSGGSDG